MHFILYRTRHHARSYRLERLKADREGQYSIRVNDQWRICFRWQNGDAHEVEVVDYH
jgi:proteic killer suppression protein